YAPRAECADETAVLFCGQVGPDQIELRLLAVERAVTNEEDEDRALRPRRALQGFKLAPHLDGCGPRGPRVGRLFRQHLHMVFRKLQPFSERTPQLLCPLRELLRILLLSARPADDDGELVWVSGQARGLSLWRKGVRHKDTKTQ